MRPGIWQDLHRAVDPEDRTLGQSGRICPIVGEISRLVGENPLHTLEGGHVDIRIFALQSPKTVLSLLKLLIYPQPVDPVYVAAGREVQLHFLY